jgi:serine/threonine protein kinase
VKLAPGTVFANDYEVVRELSAGGMGTVYVVNQRSTGKQRALKLMLPQLVSDPELRRRFEQEARVASLIESEHVVEVVGAGIDEASGAPWLAMELLRGDELTSAAVIGAPNPVAALHAILRQVCHAVGAAHRAGIVHRDLKPENMYLAESKRANESRTVKVLDFGIAKIQAEASTKHTAAMGSPIWMAPEQAERNAVTPAADVWSLGLVAYNLLTDKFFWHAAQREDGTIHQVMREVLFDPIPTASKRAAEQGAPALPPWFDGWFAMCVVRDPLQRFADASAAFAAFDVAAGLPVSSTPQPAISYIPQRVSDAPPQRISTQMAAGFTQAPVSVAPPSSIEYRRRARWVVPLLGVIAIGGVSTLAWERRYARSHVDVPKQPTEIPSATADLPDEDDDAGPAPVLVADAGPQKKRKKHGTIVTTGPVPSALASAIASSGSAPPPPPTDDHKFDRQRARDLLNAVDLQHCSTLLGPKGPGRVNVFFSNDGVPHSFVIDPPQSPYANTPTETCITGSLQGVRVAPFQGQTQMVVRNFALK